MERERKRERVRIQIAKESIFRDRSAIADAMKEKERAEWYYERIYTHELRSK